jgi:hypothetical protein
MIVIGFMLMPMVLVLSACGCLATPVPSPTATYLPSPSRAPFPPTMTIEPPPIDGPRPILEVLKIYIDQLPLEVEVVDIRYTSGEHGEGTILYVEARSTAESYHATGPTITVVHTMKVFHEDGVVFRSGTRELHVLEYDNDFTRRGMEVMQWKDVLDWFEDRISLEELRSRMQRSP